MLFLKRENFTTKETGIALGATKTFKIPRLFHIESLFIRVKVTVSNVTGSAAMATANADGMANILKRCTLDVSDGASTRKVVDMSGRGLLDYAQQIAGVDVYFATNKDINSDAVSYTFYYPIYCCHPQVADPLGSALLLPAPRYNDDPVLTLTFASQSDMDVNGTPIFAIDAMEADVVVHRREVTDPKLRPLNWELAENTVAYPSTVSKYAYDLPIPGSYTGLLLRCYTSTSARGDVSQTDGVFSLEALGNVIRRVRLLDLLTLNSVSYGSSATFNTAGNYYFDFLSDKIGESVSDFGSLLDANPLAGSGSKLQLIQDITGGAGVQIKYVTHRIFGDLSRFKLAAKK